MSIQTKRYWVSKVVGVVLCLMVLMGCSVLSLRHTAYTELIYPEDFSSGARGWHYDRLDPFNTMMGCIGRCGGTTDCLIPALWIDGYIESRSPWWIDPNHKDPGAGYLHVVFAVWSDSYYGGLPQKTLDLTNSYVRLKIMIEELELRGGHLYFWFQHEYQHDPNPHNALKEWKRTNFALTQYPIETLVTPNVWNEVTLPLSPLNSAWRCLGSSDERQNNYGCVPVENALSHINLNFGFIILPVDSNNPATGKIMLDDITIYKP